MLDLAIVGGGLFGSIIARAATDAGASVTLIDDARGGRGSAAAGCVMRPSWMSKMSRAQIDEAFELLDKLYGVEEIEFRLPVGSVMAKRVDPGKILKVMQIRSVLSVARDVVRTERGDVEARRVVVAAGIWTGELCPWVAVEGRWGWAHRGHPVRRPFITPWAPYRQIVGLNLDDGRSWVGDGQALKHVTNERAKASHDRCIKAARVKFDEVILGARPYSETSGEPCLVSDRGGVIAVTGGAKNGTAAAAWAAARIVERLS